MKAFPYLRDRLPPITVIPTCADLTRFVPAQSPPNGFVLGYVGSVGTWYLFDMVVECFVRLLLLRPDARLLIINRNEHAYIRQCLAAGGVPENVVDIRAVDHSGVPAQMAQMHAAVFFIKQAFSKQAAAPTKLGEFLGCGIPCLSNTRVGDMAEILESEGVGIAIDGFTQRDLDEGLMSLISLTDTKGIHELCVAAARKHFSLQEGVASYEVIYKELDG